MALIQQVFFEKKFATMVVILEALKDLSRLSLYDKYVARMRVYCA